MATSTSNDSGGFDTVRVMSFNIRFANPEDGKFVWKNRKHMVTSLIQNQADIACLQEVLHSQLEDLAGALKDFKHIGIGRDDGKEKGEHVPILYNHNKFKLLEHGHFWLSEKPNDPGSKSWDTRCTRMCTWALFSRKEYQGQPSNPNLPQFYVFNTHLDHRSEQARVEGTKLVLSTIQQKSQGKIPTILTGDFNCEPTDQPYQVVTKGEKFSMQNTKDVSLTGHHGPTITCQGFNIDQTHVIDYIFIHTGDRDNWSVLTHGVLPDMWENNIPASDHRPVVCDILMKW